MKHDVLILGEINAATGTLNIKDVDGKIQIAMLPNGWVSIPAGGLSLPNNGYLNFGDSGDGGHGLKSEAGRLLFKNAGGTWIPVDYMDPDCVVTVAAAGPTDDVTITPSTRLVVMATLTNSVTIGGFSGGTENQIINVVKRSSVNTATLEHNEGGGSEDILLSGLADDSIGPSARGGWTLYFFNGYWYEI